MHPLNNIPRRIRTTIVYENYFKLAALKYRTCEISWTSDSSASAFANVGTTIETLAGIALALMVASHRVHTRAPIGIFRSIFLSQNSVKWVLNGRNKM